jgi:hypothetical protein
MGLLNAHAGVHIRGENFGFLYHQFKSFQALDLSAGHENEERGSQAPFFGAHLVDAAPIREHIRSICRSFVNSNLPEGTVITGFKEIRYDMPDLEDYLLFIDSLFAESSFVFLTRDIDEVINSAFWKSVVPSAAKAKLEAMYERFKVAASRLQPKAFTLDYADISGPTARLGDLFDWLGLDFEEQRAAPVLSSPHSYDIESVHFYKGNRLQAISRPQLHKELEYFHLDRLSQSPDGLSIVIAGVLLGHADGPPVQEVFGVAGGAGPHNSGEKLRGDMGLASPGVHQRFSSNPYSSHARFKIGIAFSLGVVDLYFRKDREPVKLGQIVLSGPEESSFLEPSVGYNSSSKG